MFIEGVINSVIKLGGKVGRRLIVRGIVERVIKSVIDFGG